MFLSLFLLSLLTLILIMPLKLEIQYSRNDLVDQLQVVFWLWRLPIGINNSLVQFMKNRVVPNRKKNPVFDTTLIFQEIEQLKLLVKYSTGEASITGIANGLLWAGISTVYSWMRNSFKFATRPMINITPSFGQAKLEIRLSCIFRTRVGQIILRALKQQFGKRRVPG